MDKMHTRIRAGILISIEEIKDRMRHERLELWSIVQNEPEYIGYMDIWNGTGRVYIFGSPEAAARILKEIRKAGYETCGPILESVMIKNSQLERPHLSAYRGHAFLRELYK